MERNVLSFEEISAFLSDGWVLCCETYSLQKSMPRDFGPPIVHSILLTDDCVEGFVEKDCHIEE